MAFSLRKAICMANNGSINTASLEAFQAVLPVCPLNPFHFSISMVFSHVIDKIDIRMNTFGGEHHDRQSESLKTWST
jgi:hypothetical protein